MMPLPVQTLFDLGLSDVVPAAERIMSYLLVHWATCTPSCLTESVAGRVRSRLPPRLFDSTVASIRMSGCLEGYQYQRHQ